MAAEAGHETPGLIQDLLERAPEYDFFQALRLLLRVGTAEGGANALHRQLRIRPQLGLDYPESELVEVRPLGPGKGYEVVATLEGLYGVNSPLPAAYTEELLDDEWDEQEAPREFLDLIHRYLYPLLYRAWLKYRFTQNAVETSNPDYWNILYSFGGLGDAKLTESAGELRPALRYLGLFSLQSRSAVGLQTLLQDYFGALPVAIEQCVPRWVAIPADQRMGLGAYSCSLGEDAVVGSQVEDRSGKIEIHLGPVAGQDYHDLVGDAQRMDLLRFLLGAYLIQPFAVDLVIHLIRGSHPSAHLGGAVWSKLGEDTWVGTDGDGQGAPSLLRLKLQ